MVVTSVLIIGPLLSRMLTSYSSASTIQVVHAHPTMLAGLEPMLGRITTLRILQAHTPSLGDKEKMGVPILLKTRFGLTTSASILESLGNPEVSPQLHCCLTCQVRLDSSKNSQRVHATLVQETRPMRSTAGVTMVEPQA